jgi:hypothetical protein
VRYASKETGAPTEFTVPAAVYPDGFYVWVSVGRCNLGPEDLHALPPAHRRRAGFEHFVRSCRPTPAREARGLAYFFKGDQVVQK